MIECRYHISYIVQCCMLSIDFDDTDDTRQLKKSGYLGWQITDEENDSKLIGPYSVLTTYSLDIFANFLCE